MMIISSVLSLLLMLMPKDPPSTTNDSQPGLRYARRLDYAPSSTPV